MEKKNLFIETYGCQMNFSDSEIVVSILEENNYNLVSDYKQADVILMNTCSIRDNAESRVLNRLQEFKSYRAKKQDTIIGLIGCMAERMKEELIEKQKVDLVVGPDAYRNIPQLIEEAKQGKTAINVILSHIETYDNISPIRYDSNGVTAFISIMRGCENFCSYCVVPYTRGKERSRDPKTIISEAQQLFNSGYREITLLGQNVNSYQWKTEEDNLIDFSDLIKQVAHIHPLLRIRFATSHPKDLSDKLLYTIRDHKNICNYIHLPAQSGSSKILKLMNRSYNREWYMDRIQAIRNIIPDCGISTDIIAGFCSETEEDHLETLSLMRWVGYDSAFMFKYSERPNTYAWKKLNDDISEEIKGRRLTEIIDLQQELSLNQNKKDLGKICEVLVEGISKKSDKKVYGRNSQNKVVIFDRLNYKAGDYAMVEIIDCSAATLIGKVI